MANWVCTTQHKKEKRNKKKCLNFQQKKKEERTNVSLGLRRRPWKVKDR